MARYCLCLLLMSCMSFIATAQEGYITNTRLIEEDRFDDMLDGKAGILLLSKNNDLVIRQTNLSEQSNPKSWLNKQRPDGYYEYYFLTPAPEAVKIEVSRRGSVYRTEIAELTKQDFLTAYRIDDTENPIRVDEDTRPNAVHLNAEEAELEFRTTIQDLLLKTSADLHATISRKVNEADNSQIILTVVIPVKPIQAAKEALSVATEKAEQHQKMMDNEVQSMSDSDWEKAKALEEQLNEQVELCNTRFVELTTISISGDRTNELRIDISDLGPRVKKSFIVLPLTIESPTEANMLTQQATVLFADRKYKEARVIYESALQTEDITPAMKPVIEQSISDCDFCFRTEQSAIGALKQVKESTTQEEAAKYASAGIEYLQQLMAYNPQEFYSKRIAQLEKILESLPLLIKFTIVEWKTLHEGAPIRNVEIWGYYGKKPLATKEFSSYKSTQKIIAKSDAGDFQQLSLSDIKGVAEIEFDRKHLPKFILFCPEKDSKAKIKRMSMGEILRTSESLSYKERQIRLKMFVK